MELLFYFLIYLIALPRKTPVILVSNLLAIKSKNKNKMVPTSYSFSKLLNSIKAMKRIESP